MKAVKNIRALHNDRDYAWALREVERYFDKPPKPGTRAADRFDVLATLIHAYEEEHYPIPENSDPVDVLLFAIESMGRSRTELVRLLGSNRVSDILNRKRDLSLNQIRKISAEWHLPIEMLVAKTRDRVPA
jgi:HTH-type transcriptional regulator / antitoxin HigA